jgi:hypothetical protein
MTARLLSLALCSGQENCNSAPGQIGENCGVYAFAVSETCCAIYINVYNTTLSDVNGRYAEPKQCEAASKHLTDTIQAGRWACNHKSPRRVTPFPWTEGLAKILHTSDLAQTQAHKQAPLDLGASEATRQASRSPGSACL